MKKLLLLFLLAGCKENPLNIANRRTGGGALCQQQPNTNEILCMKNGIRYSCLVEEISEKAECVVTHTTPAEGK